jgi:hypothetical protein
MSKIGLHCPFGYLKHKLWPKEGLGVKLAIWLSTTKSRELTRFPYVQVACDTSLENYWLGYNFALDLISIQGLHAKLWRPKVAGVPTLTKSHLNVGPMGSHRVYYKGEGGGFPQVRVVVSLVSPSCSWLVLAPKVFQLCTNNFVLVLCRPLWVSEACQFFLVPSRSSNTPLYPSKALRAREHALTHFSFIIFCLGFTFESLKELGARHYWYLSYLWLLMFLVVILLIIIGGYFINGH